MIKEMLLYTSVIPTKTDAFFKLLSDNVELVPEGLRYTTNIEIYNFEDGTTALELYYMRPETPDEKESRSEHDMWISEQLATRKRMIAEHQKAQNEGEQNV